MSDSFSEQYLADVIERFRAYKELCERAIAQVSDGDLFVKLDSESNSIAVIMKHLVGNMTSRWTDFLTTDGEKPGRDRDLEFVIESEITRDQLIGSWERAWAVVFSAVEPLSKEDFQRKVRVRGEDHSIIQAVNRQMTHYAYHIGQIVFLAKHLRGNQWQSISVPRNRSQEFNRYLASKLEQGEMLESPMNEAAEFAKELSAAGRNDDKDDPRFTNGRLSR
jgi:hypothetical protein